MSAECPVRLRALEPEDWEVLYQWENDMKNWPVSQTLSPYSKYVLQQFIKSSNNDIFVDKQLRLMVEKISTGETVGVLDFFEMDVLHKRVGIGILIGEPFRNCGYASETLQQAKTLAFEVWKVHQIYCHIMQSNQGSLHLFQQAGFTIEGLKKDWVVTHDGYEDVYFLQCLNAQD